MTCLTDDDAMFVSKNYPKLKMGVINGNEGWLTDKNVVFQHFRVVRGLCSNEGTISFESVISPGNFLRHQGFKIYLHPRQDSRLYRFDACFYPKYDKFFKVGLFVNINIRKLPRVVFSADLNNHNQLNF